MNPILERRDRLAPYLAAWLILGGLLAAAVARPGGLSLGQSLAVLVPVTLVYGFVCLSAWYVCRATPLGPGRTGTLVANLGGSAVVAGAFYLALANGWSRLLGAAGVEGALPSLVWREGWLFFTVAALLYLLAAAVHYVAIAAEQSREAEQRALSLQLLAREAELKALRAQIDPHFLFNCLHSISALTGTDPAAARRMSLLLGDFLRSSVRLGAQEQIPFAEELALAERYLEIERVRFGSRLTIERAVAEDVGACLVPALLLQPLVENAVTHGVAHLLEGGTVRLEASRGGDRLTIAVENRCDPDRPKRPRTGVGLQNVRRRLAAQYGPTAAVSAVEGSGRFRVELTVPCSLPRPEGGTDG